ncbi:hypothetical protein NPIL_58291 [Nephila pilipes]|uniref:Uncharacterized protein n=1 Tax=Nephila pilipes TaxID=299642 RepID=A0A8X6NLM0_NEPPI|nr:hypothetical protein NPIL_58291 [Nephila pilipes]
MESIGHGIFLAAFILMEKVVPKTSLYEYPLLGRLKLDLLSPPDVQTAQFPGELFRNLARRSGEPPPPNKVQRGKVRIPLEWDSEGKTANGWYIKATCSKRF